MAKKKALPIVSASSIESLTAVIQSGNSTINNTLQTNFGGAIQELQNIQTSLTQIKALFVTASNPEKKNVLSAGKKDEKSGRTLVEETLLGIRNALGDIYDLNFEMLSFMKGDELLKEEERREKNRAEKYGGKSPVEKATKPQAGKASGLGDILKGIGMVGLGLGGFFLGLAGAEAIMSKFGNGDNIKAMMINLAEGLQAFDNRGLLALGALLGAGMLFGAVPMMSGLGAGVGLAAVGLGLGGFFGGLALGDAAGAFFNADGAFIKMQMINLAEGLKAFDDRGLLALGALLGTGMLFGAVMGAPKAVKGGIGMGAIGLGLGGFFAGLSVGDYLSVGDGSNIKTLMVNLAEGLNAFSGQSMVALGSLLGAGALFGAVGGPAAAGGAALGMTAIGLGLAGFIGAFSTVGDALGFFGVDGSGMRDLMINTAAGLNAFNGVDGKNLLTLIPAIAGIGPAMLALLGANGLASLGGAIADSVKSAWNWLTGGEDDPKPEKTIVHKIIELIKPFEQLDPSKYTAIAHVGDFLQSFMKSIGDLGNIDAGAIGEKLKEIGRAMSLNVPKIEMAIVGGTNDEGVVIKGLASKDINYNLAVRRIQQLQYALAGPSAVDVSPKPSVSGSGAGSTIDGASKEASNVAVGGTNVVTSAPTSVNNSTVVNNSSHTSVAPSASRYYPLNNRRNSFGSRFGNQYW